MGDLVGGWVNWQLKKDINSAPPDVKHFGGTLRCLKCGAQDRCVIPAPLWAMTAPTPGCEEDGCDGLMVFVHPDDEPPEGEEPYDYFVVLPDDRD